MSRLLNNRAVPAADISFINHQYLHSCLGTTDPTMVWGTDVDAEALLAFVKRHNQTSEVFVSPAHLLIRAVGRGLAQYPRLNSRVVGSRVYPFRQANVRMVTYNPRTADVDIVTIEQADQTSVDEIAKSLWESQMQVVNEEHVDRVDKAVLNAGPTWMRRMIARTFWWANRKFRLPRLGRIDRHLDSAVLINYLADSGSPPMRTYKPSKFPDECSLLSVTMGRPEEKPVVHDGGIVIRRVAPLFVRADHRVTDAHELSRFVAALIESLEQPQQLAEAAQTHADGVQTNMPAANTTPALTVQNFELQKAG